MIDPTEETILAITVYLKRQRAIFETMSQGLDENANLFKETLAQIDEAIAHLQAGAFSRTISLLEEQRHITSKINLNTIEKDEVNRVVFKLLDEWLRVLKKQIQS
ncbi:MAG: hypothetical protein WDN47_02110 [Candidatus Doudnabacteria bacterium]